MMKKNFWLTEFFGPHEKHSHKIKKVLVSEKTKYQQATIADSCSFGRCLILDREMQSAEFDEYIYHEALVHPALILHPNPQKILILGGGEGATLREILKHRTVKKVVMVDIDGQVVDLCKKYLTKWHQGAFNDHRVELIIDDAKNYIEQTTEKFDVVISDLPSSLKEGPAYQLYTVEFFENMIKVLNKKCGIFTIQSGSACLLEISMHSRICRTLQKVFKNIYPYYQFIPSFDVLWGFTMCTNNVQPLTKNEEQLDRSIKERIKGDLKFYDGITHHGLFRTPKNIRTILDKERQVITLKKPSFIYK